MMASGVNRKNEHDEATSQKGLSQSVGSGAAFQGDCPEAEPWRRGVAVMGLLLKTWPPALLAVGLPGHSVSGAMWQKTLATG